MKVKIIKYHKLSMSPRESKEFFEGKIYDIPDIKAKRLVELKCATYELDDNKENLTGIKSEVKKTRKYKDKVK
jgi:hypothetical protein